MLVNEASMIESAAASSSSTNSNSNKLRLDQVNGLFLWFLNEQCLDFESSLQQPKASSNDSILQIKKPMTQEDWMVRGAGSPYAQEPIPVSAVKKVMKECKNCGASESDTPMFRKVDSDLLCNACGLYYKKHKKQRVPRKTSSSTSSSIHASLSMQQHIMGKAPERIENLAAHMLPTRRLRVESVQIQPLPNPVPVSVPVHHHHNHNHQDRDRDEGYNSRTLSSFWSLSSATPFHHHHDDSLSNTMSSFSSSSFDSMSSVSSLLLEGLDNSHLEYSNQSI